MNRVFVHIALNSLFLAVCSVFFLHVALALLR